MQKESNPKPLFNRIAESKWVPLKSIPDEDYERMLSKKLLRTDAEIAMLDERLASLRSPKGEVSATSPKE